MACFRYSTLTLILLVGGGTTVSVLGCNDFPVRPHRYEPSELVTDGGFEHPKIAAYEYDSYSAGAYFDAWTIGSGAIDQLSGRVWGPADGAQSIDMDGSCG